MTTLKDHNNFPVTDHKDVEMCNLPRKEFCFSVCLVASVLYKLGYQNVSPDLGISQLLFLKYSAHIFPFNSSVILIIEQC